MIGDANQKPIEDVVLVAKFCINQMTMWQKPHIGWPAVAQGLGCKEKDKTQNWGD
jgi:hypothetical protein